MLLFPQEVVAVDSCLASTVPEYVTPFVSGSHRAMMERRSLGVGYKLLHCRSPSPDLLKACSNLRSSPYTKSKPNYVRFSLQVRNVESKWKRKVVQSEKFRHKAYPPQYLI
jgi:hypothetical protein